jgi:dephospho-CoA kinase
MVRLALTGGIGSGKSTVLGYFKRLGAAIVECDAIVHEELEKNRVLRRKLAQSFGKGILTNDGVDRAKLARHVFGDASRTRRLNNLVHPLVKRRLLDFLRRTRRRVAVAEVPLLFEAGFESYFDGVVGVVVDPRVLSSRWRRSGRMSLREIRRRSRRQMSSENKIARCDFIIDNSFSKTRTYAQVKKLMEDGPWRNSK